MTSDELRTAGANLREFVEMRGGKWDASMFDALGREALHLSEAEFYAALQRCKAELRYPPLPVDITDRCPSLAVQSADEAWTRIGSSSERDTVTMRTGWPGGRPLRAKLGREFSEDKDKDRDQARSGLARKAGDR